MDPITHVALATGITEAGFRRDLGARAVVAGAVMTILPDLDIFFRFGKPWTTMLHHRGPTHSLVVLALAAPLVGLLLGGLSRRRGSFRQWTFLALWVLLTHAFIDLCTSYGTQIFWPITHRRFSLDAIAIIDPLYTLGLFPAFVFACVPRIRRFSRAFAICALAVTTAYLVFGYVQRQHARSIASAQLEREGFHAVRVRACPLPLTNLVWHVVGIDAHRDLRVGTVSTWAPREIRFVTLSWPESPLVTRALETPEGRLFDWFADGLLSASVEREDGSTAVVFRDQRYGMVTDPAATVFAVRMVFDADGRFVEAFPTHGRPTLRYRSQFSALWRLLKGEQANFTDKEP